MKSAIFVASYWRDFPWLRPCLRSLHHYARSFYEIVVCVDTADLPLAETIATECCPRARLVTKDVRGSHSTAGFMRAQVAMMQADVFCPEADIIFLVGSDCMAVAELAPDPYLTPEGRPIVLMAGYDVMARIHPGTIPWRSGVKAVLGFAPEFEYMRRLPSVFHREELAALRSAVEQRHRRPFDDTIHALAAQGVPISEANLIGANGHRLSPPLSDYRDIGGAGLYNAPLPDYPNALLQLWSHGGMEHLIDSRFEIRGIPVTGRTPTSVINQLYREMGVVCES